MSETIALAQGLPSHIRPGLVIAGKYRLEEQIGRGSMGTVYRAVHVSLGQRVAVKLISAEHSQSLEARRRFSTEAKAVAKLRSRHVVQVYDDGETAEGNPYIVLELLEGETLEQRIQRERDISLRDATRVVAHVGRALARAHAAGIVHRDLKPANIFLVKTEDDEVGWLAKVLDFGIAKLDGHGESGTTQAGTVLGTPLFMSPEQVLGASSVDHRADLYSLGMCLYHMLTGEFAFYANNYSEILVGICTLPLPPLCAKAPWVPEAVEVWFQRACAKQPLERFQSADELVEALQVAAGHAALSKHESVPEGRIAPQTLVGYAAPPAIATRHNDASLARTQRLPQVVHPSAMSPGFAGPNAGAPPPPVAISVSSNQKRVLGGDVASPARSLSPLLIGTALGLLAIASISLALLLRRPPSGSRHEVKPWTDSSTRLVLPLASPASTVLQTPVHPEPAVSSVTAEQRLPPSKGAIKTQRGAGSKLPATAPHGPKPAAPKAPDTDLGF